MHMLYASYREFSERPSWVEALCTAISPEDLFDLVAPIHICQESVSQKKSQAQEAIKKLAQLAQRNRNINNAFFSGVEIPVLLSEIANGRFDFGDEQTTPLGDGEWSCIFQAADKNLRDIYNDLLAEIVEELLPEDSEFWVNSDGSYSYVIDGKTLFRGEGLAMFDFCESSQYLIEQIEDTSSDLRFAM